MLTSVVRILVAGALALVPASAPPPSPLQLVVESTELTEPLRPGEPSRGLNVTLFNPGPKVVHGWSVQTMATFADGHTSYGGNTSDGHAYPVREDGSGGPIVVGGRRHLRSGYSSRAGATDAPVSIGARVTAVIFEDDTAVGDEKEIEWLFARRALNQRTWPRVEEIVTAAIAEGGEPRTVLERIASELDAIKGEDSQGTDAWAAGRTLSMNLKFTRDPTALLKHFLADIQQKRAATEAHWQRKY
jgi:hypothetical protein